MYTKKINKIISYLGSKVNLYDFLDEIILQNNNQNNNDIYFFDLFAGTHSVGNYILDNTDWKLVNNDLSLYSYYLSYFLYFSNIDKNKYSIEKIIKILKYLDKLELINDGLIFNEFSANGNTKSIDDSIKESLFSNQPINSRMFFKENTGKKIDTIKNAIISMKKENKIDDFIEGILKIFLLNFVDKNKNTTSVYGAYLKHFKKKDKVFLDENLISHLLYNNKPKDIISYNETVSNCLDKIYEDNSFNKNKNNNIVYLDPPYSTRSYESNYHILNYIVNDNFKIEDIKRNSKSAMPLFKGENPFNKKSETYHIFFDMIKKSLKFSNKIFISYSSDGLMQQEDLIKITSELNANLITHKKSYKRFKSANPETKKLKEKLNKLNYELSKDKNNKELIQNIENINSKINSLKNSHKKDGKELFEIIWEISGNN